MCVSNHGDGRQGQQTQRRRNKGVLDGPSEARDDVSVCSGAAVRGAAAAVSQCERSMLITFRRACVFVCVNRRTPVGKRDGGPDRHYQMTNVLLDLLTKQQEKEHLDVDAEERRQVLRPDHHTPSHL